MTLRTTNRLLRRAAQNGEFGVASAYRAATVRKPVPVQVQS